MTRAKAPLPPEMPMMPSSGSWNSALCSYGVEGTCRMTKRPLFRMRTVLWPKEEWRKISAARYLLFSVLRAHSVSMYWIAHWTSWRAVLHMPKSVVLVMRPRPHSRWISGSSAKQSVVRTQRRLQRVGSSTSFLRMVRRTLMTASCCLCTSAKLLLAGGSMPIAKMMRSHGCMLTRFLMSFSGYFSAAFVWTLEMPMRPGGACSMISLQ
mmetsp:Transcript_20143/g.45878  ORF Transcript_20143/g.45878 Transcript_20143/m.45878 type:complete len:209 (+) Transcript_20143:1043-1669(+)